MRVFNQTKTEELTDYDIEKGYLKQDKLLKEHHEEIAGKSIEELVAGYRSQGKQIYETNDKLYLVTKEFSNGGREVEEIKPIPKVEAYDEYEDIQVYIPYTGQELIEIEKNKLRAWRETCFNVIDRACWYDSLTNEEKSEVKQFRQDLLDITETMQKPQIPNCVALDLNKVV